MTVDESKLRQLVTVFLEENKKLNLSAFRSEEHCWVGNVLDSVAFLQSFEVLPELNNVKSILDIGTGGGFPLLPLALSLPDVKCTGMDSTRKKLDAIQRIILTMDIKNASVICGRFEDHAQANLRGTFDVVTARAVAPLSVLLEYAVPFLKVGGLCAFWKSSKVADEMAMSANAQKILKAPFVRTFEYELPEAFGKRIIVFFRKTAETPKDYPRKTGIPKQQPL